MLTLECFKHMQLFAVSVVSGGIQDVYILNELVLYFIVPFLIFLMYLELSVRTECESSNTL